MSRVCYPCRAGPWGSLGPLLGGDPFPLGMRLSVLQSRDTGRAFFADQVISDAPPKI